MVAVTIGYANLDFTRSLAAQVADIRELYRKATVVALVECKVDLDATPHRAHVAQPRRLREAIASHRRLLAQGSVRASRHNYGHRIGPRRFVWAVPDLGDAFPKTAVIAVHMPPRRMWGPLYTAYVVALMLLIRRLRRRGLEVIALGDWNKRARRDPGRLRARMRGRVFGSRIDGGYATPGIAKHITSYREESRPGRTDNHPFCYLTLEAS